MEKKKEKKEERSTSASINGENFPPMTYKDLLPLLNPSPPPHLSLISPLLLPLLLPLFSTPSHPPLLTFHGLGVLL
jgi:hypothetical protein